MPFVICSTDDALAFKVAVANRTSATCDGARSKGRGSAKDRDSIFWGFERLRRATGSLTNSPTLSRIATIGFILAARYLAVQFLDQRELFALPFCLVTKGWSPLMSTIGLVDPELRDALAQQLPPLSAESLTQRRANALELAETVPKPNLPDIATEEIHVESAFGAKPIRVLTYRPVTSNDSLPAIVHIHGGGFVMGAPEMKDVENRLFASELRCAIYSVDHCLAPESPHPAPLEDIYSVFTWLHANAGQLGLDPARIGIKGESGGGGFAAAAALYARDRQGPKFAFQHLIYPMIDDRTAVRKDLHPYVGEFVWTQANNYFGWRSLLDVEPGAADVSPYAAAARAPDVSGLPPTYISVGGLDLFLEENIIYADRLSRAGVPVELHIYPRAYHGFYRATNARVTKQAEHDNREALRRFLHG